jgi:hypothetical protein
MKDIYPNVANIAHFFISCESCSSFLMLSHEGAGESMPALGRLCGFAHTSVKEAIETAREEKDGTH